MKGALVGKPAGVFVSIGTQVGIRALYLLAFDWWQWQGELAGLRQACGSHRRPPH